MVDSVAQAFRPARLAMLRQRCFICLVLVLAPLSPASGQPKFYPSDPLLADNDRLIDVTQEPAEIELSDLWDRFSHIFHIFGDPPYPVFVEAQNVNTLDEVPDSSWFTSRHAQRRMSTLELVRGPNVDGPPDPNTTWTVIAGKSQGITPGFTIQDAQGRRYVIKLDPIHVPELATAAEAIGTRLFYALGYHTPQNYIVRVHPDRFVPKPGTMVDDAFGGEVPLTPRRMTWMLREVPRDSQGRIRVIASRFIEGVPLGPFRYHETRSDDPNDVIPHEHRRELRGLRLFAAWTNHDDTRAHNTHTSWIEEGGRHYVKHYMLDFGSTFGSGSVDLQLPNLSYHYWLSLDEVTKNARSLGSRVPRYRKVEWPDFPEYEAVGRWESASFDPAGWRNDYPNPAFVRMTARDAFWAAKIIMSFTPDELMAIVQTGEFSNPEHTRYFHQVLVERQRKSGEFGINLLNPVDEFALSGDALTFVNLSEKYQFVAASSTRYRVSWSLYDNRSASVRQPLGEPTSSAEPRSPLPEPRRYLGDRDLLLVAEISSLHPDHPHWERPVRVHLRSTGARYEMVGIERDAPQEYVGMK